MITVRTSPAYVNRVRQDWTANGGVYGDGGVYAVVPSNDPFAQLGPTLDLTFAGVPTDQFTAATTDGYSINLNLSSEIYQIAAQYAVWVDGSGMTQRNFADIVTFTRASTATYFNSAGVLTTAAINEARFDFNPSTLAAQGLLIEEQRTNSIRNNTMQGAVAGTPGTAPNNWAVSGLGTLTQQVVGTGTVNGITYIDIRLSGTTSTTQLSIRTDAVSGVAAANGQTWTQSLWTAVVAGSQTNITGIGTICNLYDSGSVYLTSVIAGGINSTATLTRTSASGTIAQVNTAFIQQLIYVNFNSGVAIDITLRIGLPQLELGAFATSVIPTTTTALTRSADVASVNTLSPWFNATEGTLFAEYVATNSAQNNAATAFSDGTNNNRMIIRATNASAQTVFIGVASASSQWAGTINTALLNTITKSAFGYKVDDVAWVRNGGTVGTDTPPAIIPTVTGLKLGADGDGTLLLNGYLRRIVYYPRRLPNADLQTITT